MQSCVRLIDLLIDGRKIFIVVDDDVVVQLIRWRKLCQKRLRIDFCCSELSADAVLC